MTRKKHFNYECRARNSQLIEVIDYNYKEIFLEFEVTDELYNYDALCPYVTAELT